MVNDPELTVVLPVYNEAGSIGSLIGEIAIAARDCCRSLEIIVVDDASQDGSVAEVTTAFDQLAGANGEQPAIPVITLLIRQPWRQGQSVALLAGFRAATGRMLLSMDADGQYDPAEIPRFIALMGEYDMVCGWRSNRSDGSARRIASLIANIVRNRITGDQLTDAGCTFRIMRTECREVLLPLDGKLSGCEFFFHPLFLRLSGYRVKELPVVHRSRKGGKSHYRLVRGRWLAGLTASIRAVRLAKELTERHGGTGGG